MQKNRPKKRVNNRTTETTPEFPESHFSSPQIVRSRAQRVQRIVFIQHAVV